MKPNAIVYTSNTGYTKAYAKILGEKTGLLVYDINEAKKTLKKCENIIYLGWLMASKIKDYGKVRNHYAICAAIGVGLGDTGAQDAAVRKANRISQDIPVFTVQGGMDYEKLKGIHRFMIDMLRKMLSNKKDRTEEESAMLTLINQGGNYVSETHLSAVLDWYQK